MNLSAEQIQSNWNKLLAYINTYISDPRREKLIGFYKKFEDRLVMMPASHKKEYHDLGKMGDSEYESYIPQTDQWRKDKLGEDYMHNKQIAFASVPDRGLFLLQEHDIKYTFNEMVAIQTHDGLYDPANEKYLKSWMPETKPRTSLPFILHQADMMAARVEFEKEWLPKFEQPQKSSSKKTNINMKTKTLGSIKSEGLKNMLNNL